MSSFESLRIIVQLNDLCSSYVKITVLIFLDQKYLE